jgi:hypothetical protein
LLRLLNSAVFLFMLHTLPEEEWVVVRVRWFLLLPIYSLSEASEPHFQLYWRHFHPVSVQF